MNSKEVLNQKEVSEIQVLAHKLRSKAGLDGGHVGTKIFEILQDDGVEVLFFSMGEKAISSILGLYLKRPNSVTNQTAHYIALNSKVSYDELIFNACHEYYHYVTGDAREMMITRTNGGGIDKNEKKANRFAAEFLLPESVLELYIKSVNNGIVKVDDLSFNVLLRLVARIIIKYHVPYVMAVKRLSEINAINTHTKRKLLDIDSRDRTSEFYKIAETINFVEFERLNDEWKITLPTTAVENILSNFDNNRISHETLENDLAIFGLKKEDFGYYSEESIEEDFEDLFKIDES